MTEQYLFQPWLQEHVQSFAPWCEEVGRGQCSIPACRSHKHGIADSLVVNMTNGFWHCDACGSYGRGPLLAAYIGQPTSTLPRKPKS
jgi:hypothetical protein